MVSSGLKTKDAVPGGSFWLCSDWLDETHDFEEVRVVERHGPRVLVETLAGPHGRRPHSVYARELWPAERLDIARERRGRDLAIDRLDLERPADSVTRTAWELCCDMAVGDIAIDHRGVKGILRRLGRDGELTGLHALAYAAEDSPYAEVVAPQVGWTVLYADFAAAEPELVEERLDATARRFTWVPPPTLSAAVALVRGWAGLAVEVEPRGGEKLTRANGAPDELARLRALVEMAAGLLEDAGRPEHALNLRRAAFPSGFPRER